ncbi:DUF4157 domain-containing protein [Pedobacter sp. PAMC26386]|nr:DUF4157 domain-containing protein [Pedobacter sp. PAMC26386]
MSNYADENKEKKGQSLSRNVSQRKKENNTGLPDDLKSGIENLSSHSLDDVKVHYNSDKPSQLQAHAYAQGTNIHLGPGQEKHLPHEAWHVVQQKQGRVQPTMQMKGGVNVNDDQELEHEADVMGAKAFQLKSATVQFGQGVSKAVSTVGRYKAVQVTSQFPKPKMGFLVHETVKPFADMFGDLASGNIGQHYEDRSDALDKDVTKVGIIRFAIIETAWWNKQKGLPGIVGSAMSARMRAGTLIAKARELDLLPKDEEKE